MPMTNKLLENIYFGNELEKLSSGTAKTLELICSYLPEHSDLLRTRSTRIVEMARRFSSARNPGRFGGQITTGDSVFIAAFMSALEPSAMIELGVCSGQSSAFMLVVADRLDLLNENEIFLHSFDLEEYFENESQPIGQVVFKNFKGQLPNWALHTGETSLDLMHSTHSARQDFQRSGNKIAFIDAEHRHPWPFVDALILSSILPRDAWILLQDIRLSERWLANTIERGVTCPTPERGVGFVYEYWPGTKFSGLEMCFNMAAIKNDITDLQRRSFAEACMRLPLEMPESNIPDLNLLLQQIV